MLGCTDFVEVNQPKNTLTSETVFQDPATVESALAYIYSQMRDEGMVSGNFGLSAIMGIYSDELDYYQFDSNYIEYYQNTLTPSNTIVEGWWKNAYNVIYAANVIIKGVDNSIKLSLDDQKKFKGQALFVRAYLHSLLVDLYGDIPYITTPDYIKNNTVERNSVSVVYDLIIKDLIEAVQLMDSSDWSGEHVIPTKSVANALLARMYLYTENWEMAKSTSDILINSYNLEPDITHVFLKNSAETLWQFKPNGISNNNTYEAIQFVIQAIPGQAYALSDGLLNAFESDDLRATHWIDSMTSKDGLTTLQYANKYKAILSEKSSLEYSIIFRLSEQYLIRAESLAHMGNIAGAQEDLNAIRNRAGLDNTDASNVNELLSAILRERRVELFTELGQRWFDLKRYGLADERLSPIKSNWQASDLLLPIPETELEINPNLKPQNTGY
tara:strand:- start:856 stop:2181 length:1326 start_codon:yes stop_codon:yes gene_type:complete